ncbi:GH23042 [Drosophila grimshawi]|uniref:GH23042 n=2 Tax=Drosophila grimshawi TaxID=7222 RepID=B4JWH4_DROGR|nr:GH23042 [Drosophila grimshawi]
MRPESIDFNNPERSTIPTRRSRTRQTQQAITYGKRKTTRGTTHLVSQQRKKSMKATQAPQTNQVEMIRDLAVGTSHQCDGQHDGRIFIKTNLRFDVDALFELLFSPAGSTFLRKFHAGRSSTDLCFGKWNCNVAGQQERQVSMIVALQANVGPKSARIVERQTIRQCSAKGEIYSIDVESLNQGIPYADVFTILMHYCLKRSPGNTTDILVVGDINFVKSTWAIVKTFILKHSLEGMAEYFYSLHQQLLKEAETMNRR